MHSLHNGCPRYSVHTLSGFAVQLQLKQHAVCVMSALSHALKPLMPRLDAQVHNVFFVLTLRASFSHKPGFTCTGGSAT